MKHYTPSITPSEHLRLKHQLASNLDVALREAKERGVPIDARMYYTSEDGARHLEIYRVHPDGTASKTADYITTQPKKRTT